MENHLLGAVEERMEEEGSGGYWVDKASGGVGYMHTVETSYAELTKIK